MTHDDPTDGPNNPDTSAPDGDGTVDAAESQVLVEWLSDDRDMLPADATPVGDNRFAISNTDGFPIDTLDEYGVLTVVDWDWTGPDKDRFMSGPVEPIRQESGIKLVYADDLGDLKTVPLGKFICERCGSTKQIPVAPDADELPAPGDCLGCERNGPWVHAGMDDMAGDVSVSEFLNDAWDMPSNVDDARADQLWDDVRDWVWTYWDAAGREHLYDGLTAWAISTWFRPNMDFLCLLVVSGKTQGGKTQLLETLRRVSYRGSTYVSITESSVFRFVHTLDQTLFMSEFHNIPKEQRQGIEGIMRGAQKRNENVARAERDSFDGAYRPKTFKPFSHVGFATQYEPPDDILNRSMVIRTKSNTRNISLYFDDGVADDIRNRLLFHRFRLHESDTWAAAEAETERWLDDEYDIRDRLAEKLLGMVTVAALFAPDGRDAMRPFVEWMKEERNQKSADSFDADVVRAIIEVALNNIGDTAFIGEDMDPWAEVEIPYTDVCDVYEDLTGSELTNSNLGHVNAARLDLNKKRKRTGVVIHDPDLLEKLQRLCEDMNIELDRLEVDGVARAIPENERFRMDCNECGYRNLMTHKHLRENYYMCAECADELNNPDVDDDMDVSVVDMNDDDD